MDVVTGREGGEAGRGTDPGDRSRRAEERVTTIATRQHGVVTWEQLLAAGLTPAKVKYRVRVGRLRRVHRGVYVLGLTTLPGGREMAAVLGCGTGAVLSHRSAAALRPVLPHPGGDTPVDVTVVGRDPGPRPGVRVHRVTKLEADEVTELDGIPITTVARTILDLAATVRPRELEQALAQVERNRFTTRAAVLALVDRYRGRKGTALLRALLQSDSKPAWTRSEGENRFRALVTEAQLPAPEVNVRVAGEEVDFYWPAERLVVEMDGFAFHSSRDRFESDRRRDAKLAAGGVQVIRVTWRQLTEEPNATLVRIAQALAIAHYR